MNISRRKFVIDAGAATAALATGSTIALADLIPDNKYQIAEHLINNVIKAIPDRNGVLLAGQTYHMTFDTEIDIVNQKASKAFDYILDNFPEIDSNTDEVLKLLFGTNYDGTPYKYRIDLSSKINWEEYPETIFCIAQFLTVIQLHKAPLNSQKCKSLVRFADKYRQTIMG